MPLLVAAGLVVLTAAAHSYLGERYLLIRLFRRPDLPQLFGSDVFTKRTLRFAWHLTSVAWLGFGALLLPAPQKLSVMGNAPLAIVAGTFAVSALITLIGSRGRHLAWIAFAGIAILAWLARG